MFDFFIFLLIFFPFWRLASLPYFLHVGPSPSSCLCAARHCSAHAPPDVSVARLCRFYFNWTDRVVWLAKLFCVDCGSATALPFAPDEGLAHTVSEPLFVFTWAADCRVCYAHDIYARLVTLSCGCSGWQYGILARCYIPSAASSAGTSSVCRELLAYCVFMHSKSSISQVLDK